MKFQGLIFKSLILEMALAQWRSTYVTSGRLVVRFHHVLTSIWNGDNQFLVTCALLTITNELWWHFSTLTEIWNDDSQWTPPYININSDDSQRSVTINNCCWYEMVTVNIHHYSHYSWWTLNVTITPILLGMKLLVKVNECHHISTPIVMAMKYPSQ